MGYEHGSKQPLSQTEAPVDLSCAAACSLLGKCACVSEQASDKQGLVGRLGIAGMWLRRIAHVGERTASEHVHDSVCWALHYT